MQNNDEGSRLIIVMRNNCLKKFLSFVMAIAMIPTFAALAEETDSSGQIVLSDEIVVLYNLGIIGDTPDKTFRPDDLITRAEFAGWLAGADNIDRRPYTDSFSDVSAENPNAESIDSLASAGIMVGNGNGTFSPDKPILVEEALKSVLVLLGYEPYAEAAGGYPGGYLTIGYDKDLLDGVNDGSGGQLTRNGAAVLIYNALFTNVMEPDGLSGNGVVYSENNNKTLLYKTRKIIKQTGIVTANAVTDLEGGSGVSEETLGIDGTNYTDLTDNGQKMLGKRSEFYYVDEDPGEIIYIKPAKKTASVILNSDDIDSFSGNALKAYRGSKTVSYKISPMADVIYNGKVLDYSQNDVLFRDENGVQSYYGTIELFDNDNDGQYDVMDIHAYHNIILSSTRNLDSETGKNPSDWFEIIDKNGIAVRIDPDKSCTIRDTDGNNILWTSLKENDVLALAMSKDGQYIEMILCSEVVTGEITALSDDGDKYSAVINGEKYEIRKSTGFYCVDQTEDSIGLTSGDKAFFTLDISGRIALVKDKSVNAGPAYGLIINYLISDDGSDVLIKLMRASGEIEFIAAAEKVTIDGTGYKGIEQIIKRLTEVSKELNGTDNSGKPLRKEILVNYKTNSEGKITQIDTPYLETPESNEDEQTLHVMKLQEPIDGMQKATDPVSLIYRANTFGGKIVVDSSTLFFYIPPVTSINDSSTYAVLPSGQLKIDLDHEIRAYTSNVQKQIPEAVVIYSSPVYSKNVSEIDKGTDIGVCLEKFVGLDQEENIKECISIFQGGHVINKCVDSVDIENYRSLAPGDVIRFGTNGVSNIDTIHVVYKLDENRLPRQGLGNAPDLRNANLLFTNGGARAIFGGVYSRENNVIAVVNQIKKYQDHDTNANDDGGILVNDNMADLSLKAQASIERYDVSNYQIYRYNSDSQTIEKVTPADILAYQQTQSEYDYALVFTIDYRPGIVILYSNDDVKWND